MANESLFKIGCPSCEAVFAVTDPELVGQIVACPKCGGMILIAAPEEEETAPEPENGSESIASKPESADSANWANDAERVENVESEDGEKNVAFADNVEASNGGEFDGGSGAESGKKSRKTAVFCGVGAALAGVVAIGAFCVFAPRGGDSGDSASDANKVSAVSDGDGEEWENDADSGDSADVSEDETVEIVSSADVDGEIVAESEAVDDGGEISPNGAAAENENSENAEDDEKRGVGRVQLAGPDSEKRGVGTVQIAGDAQEDELAQDAGINKVGDLTEDAGIAESEAAFVDADEIGEIDENNAISENGGVDENAGSGEDFATPDSVAGEFNEAEFEKANKAASDNPENAEPPVEDDLGAVASTTELASLTALPTMKRAAKEIDVDARLALRIKSIEFPSSPVAAVRLLSEFSGVPVAFDWDSFVLTRPSTSAALDLTATDVSVGEALEKLAELTSWRVEKRTDRVVLFPKSFEPDVFVEERFDVAELLTGEDAENGGVARIDEDASFAQNDENGADGEGAGVTQNGENAQNGGTFFLLPERLTRGTLEKFVRTFVEPNSWTENGGKGALSWDGTTLIAFQSAQNRKRITILLEQLRALRLLEAKSALPTEELIPEALAWDAASATTSFNLLEPTPIQNALEILEKSSKFPFEILWDDAALNESGVGRDALASVRVDGGTFDGALTEALEPLGLTYLALDKTLLLITTKERAKNYKTIETHFGLPPNASQKSSDEYKKLISELKLAVAPESWGVSDGVDALDADESNAVWIDEPSGVLIARQSQPNQRAVRRWLEARATRDAQDGQNAANGEDRESAQNEETTPVAKDAEMSEGSTVSEN